MDEHISIVENTVSTDVGDETANRFRYQWAYSAILCCSLLDNNTGIKEVFCEQHEDILLRQSDGLFIGVQVKTRANNQPLWTAGDDSVVKSFARFVQLNLKFSNQFKAFRFVTNHPMQATLNGKDICFLLDTIKGQKDYEGLTGVTKAFVKKIATEAESSVTDTFITLQMVEAKSDLPQFRDVTVRLVETLFSVWNEANNATYNNLREAANHLINACSCAASLASQETLPVYLGVMPIGAEQSVRDRIDGKRFNREKVEAILSEVLDDKFPLIRGKNLLDDVSTTNKELLRQKLSAGGFSAISTTYAEDLCDASDYAGTRLVQKYGREKGLQKYNELKLKVQGDSARAYEQVKQHDDPFGVQMLDDLRKEIKERATSDEELYGYTPEHLEGLAYTLTSQCKVAWSIKRPWEEK